MSRVGKNPVAIPTGVEVKIDNNNHLTVKGPKGELQRDLPIEMEITVNTDEILVQRPNDLKRMKSLHGLTRSLINNMVIGVSSGYEKKLSFPYSVYYLTFLVT